MPDKGIHSRTINRFVNTNNNFSLRSILLNPRKKIFLNPNGHLMIQKRCSTLERKWTFAASTRLRSWPSGESRSTRHCPGFIAILNSALQFWNSSPLDTTAGSMLTTSWTRSHARSIPTWQRIPKNHWLPLASDCNCGSL